MGESRLGKSLGLEAGEKEIIALESFSLLIYYLWSMPYQGLFFWENFLFPGIFNSLQISEGKWVAHSDILAFFPQASEEE